MIYAVHRPHTLFVLVQTPEAQGRENSLSEDIPFQPETRLFLPDKHSRKPNNSGYFAADQRDIPYKEWNDVSFLRAKSAGKEETEKTNEKSSGTKGYDTDGCFCLFIAILNGVGASAARRLYDKGPGQQRPRTTKAQDNKGPAALCQEAGRRTRQQCRKAQKETERFMH